MAVIRGVVRASSHLDRVRRLLAFGRRYHDRKRFADVRLDHDGRLWASGERDQGQTDEFSLGGTGIRREKRKSARTVLVPPGASCWSIVTLSLDETAVAEQEMYVHEGLTASV